MAKPIDKQKVTSIMATMDDHHIEIMVEVVDTGHIATLRIPFKGYNEAARAYVDSPEVFARAEDNLANIGVTFDNVLTDIPGKQFDAYVVGDRATLWEPRAFVEFTPITSAEARELRKLSKNYIFETVPLTEYRGNRFNFGIQVNTAEGVKNFRISQFSTPNQDPSEPDITVSVKYLTRAIDNFSQSINDEKSSLPPEAREKARASLDKMIEAERSKLIARFREVLGIDVEHMLSTDDALRVQIEVQSIPNSKYSFLVATLADTDEVAED